MRSSRKSRVDAVRDPILGRDATPQGPPDRPSYAIFLRQRSVEADFRGRVRDLCQHWAESTGVVRVRMSLFEVPDMEAERKAGYPIKTHPVEQQYQAMIDLVIEDRAVAKQLIDPARGVDVAADISTIHAYPVAACYTSVYGGRPTIVGLRGYPAHQAIEALGAANQKQISLLEWIYGPVAKDGPFQVEGQ